MTIGHVTLDGKEYMLKAGTLPTEPLANQMAPKVSSGAMEYDSQDVWSTQAFRTWQGGVGKTSPHDNGDGFLYSELETRVPSQAILSAAPGGVGYSSTSQSPVMPALAEGTGYVTLTVGSGGYAKVASWWKATVPNSTISYISLYALLPTAVSVTCQVLESAVGPASGTLRTSGSGTIGGYPYPRWYKIDLTPYTVPATPKDFWFSVYPTSGSDSITLIGADDAGLHLSYSYDGSSWSSLLDYPFFVNDGYYPASFIGGVQGSSTTTVFVANVDTAVQVFAWDNTGSDILSMPSNVASAQATSVLFYGDNILIGCGSADPLLYTTNVGATATAVAGEYADILAKHQGVCYKSIGNELFASSDPTTAGTWTSLGTASDAPFEIRGMAGLGDTLFVACDDGLWGLFPGDFLVPVGPWGSESSRNGRKMVAFQGSIYAIVNDRVWRITADGAMQDLWISRDDDLVNSRLGRVVDLATTDTGVLALVQPDDTSVSPTVWVLQGSEWHHLMTLPQGDPGFVFYERTNQRVWVGSPFRNVYYINLPETAINPYNDPGILFHYAGWLEYDWLYGAVYENSKDWESVSVMGDLAAGQTVKVYYKQAEADAWSLLGTATADGDELTWDIPRTASKRLKLGFLLTTTDPAATPRIRAITVKYMVMVKDWFRYSLNIQVSGGQNGSLSQEMLDGTFNPYTADQIKANLDALVTRDTPFVYVNPAGKQYLVKVYGAQFQYTLIRYNRTAGAKEWEGTYNITLEAVRSGEYA